MHSLAAIWNEVRPSEHFCQLYQTDRALLDSVDSFIGEGLQAGDAAIVIATPNHVRGLNERLAARGLDVPTLLEHDQYLPLDAAATLAKFMNKGWPDQMNFIEVMRGIVARASKEHRPIRAFGEMVSLLWAEGNRTATLRLEKLWNDLAKSEAFTLFCAYPQAAFASAESHSALKDICAAHSRVIKAGA